MIMRKFVESVEQYIIKKQENGICQFQVKSETKDGFLRKIMS